MTTRQVGIRLNTEGKAEVKRDFTEVGSAGQEAGKAIEASFEAASAASTKAEAAADRQMAKWRAMAKAAKDYQSQQEHQAKFNAILGVDGGGEKSARASADVFEQGLAGGLTKGQRAARLNLLRQAGDVFTTASMGMSPQMIAIQQGPQILDALALSGVAASGSMVAVGAAIAGVAVVVGVLAAVQASYEAEVVKLTVATQGLGAASGLSAEQLEATAQAAARSGETSVRSAREFASAYVETGRIGGRVLDDLVGLTKNYALTTRQDAKAATEELGRAFADPAKGAEELNSKLNFLDASEQRHIENLARAGHEAEAQALLVDKLQGALLSATDATTGWAHAFEGLATAASNGFDRVGRFVDGVVTGGSAIERLSKAREGLASIQGNDTIARELRAARQKEIDQLYKEFVADMDRLRGAAISQRSTDRQALVDRYNPNDAKLAQLKADREKLVGLGVNDAASKAALKELDDQIKALGAGYKTAAEQAAALRRQTREAASEARREARDHAKELREAAEAERHAQNLKTQDLRGELAIAKALNDPSAIDYAERQLRIQELIVQATREGVSWQLAWRDAQRQVAQEMQAEFEAIKRAASDAELAKDRFETSAERMAKAEPGPDFRKFSVVRGYIEDIRVSTGEAFHDGLVSGMTRGDFFETFKDRLKYAAAEGLADSLTSSIFGKKDGSSGGLLSALGGLFGNKGSSLVADQTGSVPWWQKTLSLGSSLFGFNAKGTDYWRGGLTWVGEEGPELINLRQGAQVYDHRSSMDLVAANDRARNQVAQALAAPSSGAVSVSATFAPVLTITGGDSEELGRMRAQLALMEANFQRNVTDAVNDAIGRRQINFGG